MIPYLIQYLFIYRVIYIYIIHRNHAIKTQVYTIYCDHVIIIYYFLALFT